MIWKELPKTLTPGENYIPFQKFVEGWCQGAGEWAKFFSPRMEKWLDSCRAKGWWESRRACHHVYLLAWSETDLCLRLNSQLDPVVCSLGLRRIQPWGKKVHLCSKWSADSMAQGKGSRRDSAFQVWYRTYLPSSLEIFKAEAPVASRGWDKLRNCLYLKSPAVVTDKGSPESQGIHLL